MHANATIPQPPAPGNPDEARRVEHTRHRYAMMEGRWLPLLEARLEAQLGTVRRAAWGVPDISNNPMRTVCYELSTLYDGTNNFRGLDKTYGAPFSLTAKLAFLVVGPMVDLKLISLQAGTFSGKFATRFAPTTFVLAVIFSLLVGWWLLT